MIGQAEARNIVNSYEPKGIHVGVFGSHSALEAADAAKDFGIPVYLVVEEGRHSLYTDDYHYLFDGPGDQTMMLDKFEHLLYKENQEKLRAANTIMIPNRSLVSYLTAKGVEEELRIPLVGSRRFLCAEDAKSLPGHSSQYDHMDAAGIRRPRQYKSPSEIDGPAIVKVRQAKRPRERAFFEVADQNDFDEMAVTAQKVGLIDAEGLANALIEEKLIGVYTNAVFHFSPIFGSMDLLGFGDREQTNWSSFLMQTAEMQHKLKARMMANRFRLTNEEITHRPKTLRESYIPQVIDAAQRFQAVLRKEEYPGMIGIAGLQGAWPIDENNKPQFTVYDIAYRWTGDPHIGRTSPFMNMITKRYRKQLREYCLKDFEVERIESMGHLTMLDILAAVKEDVLENVVT